MAHARDQFGPTSILILILLARCSPVAAGVAAAAAEEEKEGKHGDQGPDDEENWPSSERAQEKGKAVAACWKPAALAASTASAEHLASPRRTRG
ncbi:uncharacterized protein PSFLO_05302 [Pseudozyma flocculosa]|uniref:Secreted protein n=1 Tax=Pseudozyma flocculosa TaxID=84751 RepID=A0A5C3F8X8_9BASI|nr:uncharacterized protein PSFLO_05302 [Pseudozyma flocculosa]